MRRFEPILLGCFFASWISALLHQLGLWSLAGSLSLTLYQLYTVAAVLGWAAGNFYLFRSRGLPRAWRRRLLLVYLVGPPGVLYLLRSMAPEADQRMAPLVPTLSFGVYLVFFLVPMTLGRRGVEGGSSREDRGKR